MTLFELDAVLRLDSRDFDTGIDRTSRESRSFAQSIGADAESIKEAFTNAFSFSVGQVMAEGFLNFLGFSREFVQESIQVAASVQQTNEKIKVLFGESGAAAIDVWAAGMKEGYGISSQAAKEYASTIAGIFGNDMIGLSEDELLDMSMRLVELTGDLASFHNIGVDVAWQKLLSGMRGETEAIEDLGVDVRAASVAQFHNMTEAQWGKLTQYDRVTKLYEYIRSSTSHVTGDFSRTSDTFNNQMAMFAANIEELKGLIGEGLIPAANSLITFMNTLFEDHRSGAEVVSDLGESFATTYTEIGTTTQNALSLISALERMQNDGVNLSDEYSEYATVLGQLQTLIPSISGLIDDQTGAISGGTEALRAHVEAWEQDAMAAARSQILSDYYKEVVEQEIKVRKLKAEYQVTRAAENAAIRTGGQAKQEAADYLMRTYPSAYPTSDMVYRDFLGQSAGEYGLLYQLKKQGKKDPTAQAYYASITAANEAYYDAEAYDKEQTLLAEEAKLEELRENAETLNDIIREMNLALEPVSTFSGTAGETASFNRIYSGEVLNIGEEFNLGLLDDFADVITHYLNAMIDSEAGSEEMFNSIIAELNKQGGSEIASAIIAYFTASGATAPDSWAVGESGVVLPSDFFQIEDGVVRVKDWNSSLEQYKQTQGESYNPENYFGADPAEVEESVREGARQGVTEGISGLSITMDGVIVGQLVAPTVMSEMSRRVNMGRFTGGSAKG